MKQYLAIDIRKEEVRLVLGTAEGAALKQEEIARIPFELKKEEYHVVRDMEKLVTDVKAAIDQAVERFGAPESLAIDGFGGDYVLMKDDQEILPVYAGEDGRTARIMGLVDALMSREEMSARSGFSYDESSTVYQLVSDQLSGRLEGATDFLMLPEYLAYKLCGRKVREATLAASTGLLNKACGEYDKEILSALNLPEQLFPQLRRAGTPLGQYKGIKLKLCAGWNRAAAAEAVPVRGELMYLLLGEENRLGARVSRTMMAEYVPDGRAVLEGGAFYGRLETAAPGLTPVKRLKEELGLHLSAEELFAAVLESEYHETVDFTDKEFEDCYSVKCLLDTRLSRRPQSMADYLRCAYQSLAAGCEAAMNTLEEITGRRISRLYLLGEGAEDELLIRILRELPDREITAISGDPVILGNFKAQAEYKNDTRRPERYEKRTERSERSERSEKNGTTEPTEAQKQQEAAPSDGQAEPNAPKEASGQENAHYRRNRRFDRHGRGRSDNHRKPERNGEAQKTGDKQE